MRSDEIVGVLAGGLLSLPVEGSDLANFYDRAKTQTRIGRIKDLYVAV